ncbi:MAG: pseudouridine-5'-phosphate glycosidase [Acholeplasmataceae bacterium]
MNKYIVYSKEVEQAIKENKPIVALESTIISHGLPYPQNLEMARKVEGIIKEENAVPATIAIIDGVIKVGLTESELIQLATAKDVYKVGKKDFSYVLSQKKMGATTVSGTMIVAEKAKIEVFATGGIGGVHRGAQETFDISRDLEELGEANVCVVCAGAKAILDLALTLEYLETKGVEVIGYQTNKLPAFYTETSNLNINYRLDTPEDIAKLLMAKWRFGLKGGVVVANPIPSEASLDFDEIEEQIQNALAEAKEKAISGKDVTPFLLETIKNKTKGKSLQANLELVYNNARLAARIARAYKNLS